jgi:hypothetical protein
MLDQMKWDPHSPKRVEDIVGNQDVWRPLAENVRNNSCPHIVLCGPQGCGKSMFIKLLLEHEKKCPVVYIECTANSGLRDLRDLIRGFARGSRTGKGDYRWIVLEHADSLAGDTQAFLRRMMETTAHSTRFLFECSDAGAVSEPILSRSVLYSVNAPTESEVRCEIQRRTEYTLEPEEIDAIYYLSKDNMRNAICSALCQRWNRSESTLCKMYRGYKELLAKAPKDNESDREWVQWGLIVDRECRHNGLDCRDLLYLGWPTNPHVSYMRFQWSRLGGISARALFFRTVHKLCQSASQLKK